MAEAGRLGGRRGSVLMLLPAAVLVFVVLGAIAVDFAVVLLAQRQLANAAAGAANDAAAEAVDVGSFYASKSVRLAPTRAEEVVRASVGAAGLEGLDDVRTSVEVAAGEPVVTVTVTARVGYIFAKAVPGGPEWATVEATAAASAEQG
ncbi:MAG: hypothetical protein ACRDZ9_05955 [Acidimicrobiales bacterium]